MAFVQSVTVPPMPVQADSIVGLLHEPAARSMTEVAG